MGSNNIYVARSWMYNPFDEVTGEMRNEFKDGLREFMNFSTNQEIMRESGKLFCPCSKCANGKFIVVERVWRHLFSNGFTPGYYIWYSHGEDFGRSVKRGQTSRRRRRRKRVVDDDTGYREEVPIEDPVEDPVEKNIEVNDEPTVQMVNDVFREVVENRNVLEEPNAEARKYFEMLDVARQPLYAGCKEGHSPLSAATRMMNIKTEHNSSEDCVDAIANFFQEYLPEDNLSPPTYYAIQKLVAGLGLPYHQVIDACKENCMIFWKEDKDLEACKYCGSDRYKISTGSIKVVFHKMWYLPIADRLKRLYFNERTAASMSWHGNHLFSGDISHPSDAEAWKHFAETFPEFASEARNVYLGLCTDGFNPFGKSGRKYSLWHVIVTPYNLPPALCMKREFLFLSILVPGPNHPRRALDVFLQPLIEELQVLWKYGVTAYDVSTRTNFNMRVVLMWTISDFPAYSMLSGWTTHGRLSCPHCQDNTDAFRLKHGRKTSWFDCHRRFLPHDHPYRENVTDFKKNRVVFDEPPPEPTGHYLMMQLRDFDVDSTRECGGNGHEQGAHGYGEYHNWHKRSIFWELPYWKDHLVESCRAREQDQLSQMTQDSQYGNDIVLTQVEKDAIFYQELEANKWDGYGLGSLRHGIAAPRSSTSSSQSSMSELQATQRELQALKAKQRDVDFWIDHYRKQHPDVQPPSVTDPDFDIDLNE